MSIEEKAMKVTLNISCYTGRIKDKAVTQKTNDDHNASKDAGNYNKHLIKKEDLHPITSAANEARKYHKDHTLPWGEKDRILPATELMEYSASMRNYVAKFNNAVADFIARYPSIIQSRQHELGTMNNPKEYPDVNELPQRFAFKVTIDPIETAGDFRVKLSDTEVERIKNEISLREQANHKDAMKDLWERFYRVINDMAKKLSEEITHDENGRQKTGIFRDSLVGNVASLASILPKLNIDNDPHLNKLCEDAKNLLCAYTPKELRKNSAAKQETLDSANEILAAMSGYINQEAA